MMSWDEEAVAATLHQAIQIVAIQRGEDFAHSITPIILANLDRGRVQHFLDNAENRRPEEYVWRVVEFYEKWQPYLYQIQAERLTDLWLPLYDKLKWWAYNYLCRQKFPPSHNEKQEMAADCAAAAAAQLLNARFPYDTDFDPWAYVLLQTVTLKQLHRRYAEAPDEMHQIDDWDAWEGVWPQLSTPGPEDSVELRHTLLTAVDQLTSDARKQIILMRYFEQMTFPEIATALNRSSSAIHKLHFDALQNLRKIWADWQDKYE